MDNVSQKTSQKKNVGDTIDLVDLLMFYLSKIKVLIVAFVLGAILAGGATHFLMTPKYTATTKLYMVSSSSGSAIDLTDLRIGDSLSSDYVVLMRTRPLYEDVVKSLDLDYSYAQFMSMVKIEALEDTRVVIVSVESPIPEEAKDIANALARKAVNYLPKLMETPAPHIAEYAILPTAPSSPSLTKNTILGAMAFLMLALAVYTVIYLLDDTLKTSEDVEKEFGVIPLAVIPEDNTSKKNSSKSKKANNRRERR